MTERSVKVKRLFISIAATFLLAPGLYAASVEKATMLNQHGLSQEAKSELIDVIFSKSSDTDKAKAYYLLGSIAFNENNVSVALNSWRNLVDTYPSSSEVTSVKNRISELAEIVGESTKESIENAISLSYL